MAKVEMKAQLRYLRMAPRKVRILADLLIGKSAVEAIVQLEQSRRTAARPLLKLLQSAIANAKHNHESDEASLMIKQITVDGGPTLYRWMPRAMGRATPIRKRTAHIVLTLAGEVKEKKENKK
ncbi:MAG: 50S ribosomal protein L22 [Candidatus Magasanikbacteria bacterium]|nr:50S ribosomal protein L22 [Candidatus Magasanikbacteria bacterium]